MVEFIYLKNIPAKLLKDLKNISRSRGQASSYRPTDNQMYRQTDRQVQAMTIPPYNIRAYGVKMVLTYCSGMDYRTEKFSLTLQWLEIVDEMGILSIDGNNRLVKDNETQSQLTITKYRSCSAIFWSACPPFSMSLPWLSFPVLLLKRHDCKDYWYPLFF